MQEEGCIYRKNMIVSFIMGCMKDTCTFVDDLCCHPNIYHAPALGYCKIFVVYTCSVK